jgi:hypothetical protein
MEERGEFPKIASMAKKPGIRGVSQIAECGVEGASDAGDNESWFWNAWGGLHGQAQEIIRWLVRRSAT